MTSAHDFGLILAHSTWQLAAVAVLARAAGFLLRRRIPQARYAVYSAALGFMLAVPVITLLTIPEWPRFELAALQFPSAALSHSAMVVAAEALESSSGSMLPWLTTIWAAGVMGLSLRWAVAWAWLEWRLHRHCCSAAPAVGERVAALAASLGIRRRVRVVEVGWNSSPAIAGWFRPVLVVPATLAGLPAAQLEAILIHELAHVRRHDYWMNLAQRLIETLLFYHPAVWWISRLVTQERECCCDDLAAGFCGDPRTYAEALFAVETARSGGPELALAAGAGNLRRRIARILETGLPESGSGLPAVALLTAAALALAVLPVRAQIPTGVFAPGQFAKVRRAAYDRDYARVAHLGTYAKWLMENVWMIIRPEEQNAFKALTTDAERDHFIDQFWARRGEKFKAEHLRRLKYAAARNWVVPDSRNFLTDRGFFYVIYGPPDEIESHPGQWEGWRYRSPESTLIYDVNGDITPASNPFRR